MKAFYTCHSKGDEVPHDKPIEMDPDTAISVALQVLRAPGDFIGFIDPSGSTVQFYLDEPDKLWMEMPFPAEKGSYGSHFTLSAVERLIQGLPESYSVSCIPNAKFQPW